MIETYYTVEQISKLIDMHPKTIQRYIREGKLKAQKVGKSWRVTGHDLSVFVEGTSGVVDTASSPGMQSIFEDSVRNARVSTVVDIPVNNEAEAVNIINWVIAMIQSKRPEHGPTSMTSQYIMPENIIRVMLWGGLEFTSIVIDALRELESNGR